MKKILVSLMLSAVMMVFLCSSANAYNGSFVIAESVNSTNEWHSGAATGYNRTHGFSKSLPCSIRRTGVGGNYSFYLDYIVPDDGSTWDITALAIGLRSSSNYFTQTKNFSATITTSGTFTGVSVAQAKTAADTAATRAQSALNAANTAATNATAAKTSADTAATRAQTAANNAADAKTAADTAVIRSNEAKTAANTAATNATGAKTSADAAATNANTAATNATAAKASADTAATRAQTAANNAADAKTAAETAVIRSNEAKTAANTAATNATGAKTSADTAATRAQTTVNQTWYDGTYGGSSESVSDVAGYMRNSQLPNIENKVNNLAVAVTNIQSADNSPPSVELDTVSGAKATSSSSIQLVVSASDNKSTTFTYSINGGSYSTLPANGRINVSSLVNGPNNIVVRVKDDAGNIAVKTINIWRLN